MQTTNIKLSLHSDTPVEFEPTQGQVFQILELGNEPVLVMVTDDNTVVTLTGSNAGYVDSIDDIYLGRDNLVDTLEIKSFLSVSNNS